MLFYRLLSHSLLLVILAISVYAAEVHTPLGERDRTLLVELFQRGRGESALARRGLQQSQDPLIRDYALRLERDHTEMDQRIVALAGRHQLALPSEIPTEIATSLDELQKLHGARFDQAFMRRALAEHRATIGHLEDAAQHTHHDEVLEIARIALARGREHLALAQRYDLSTTPEAPGLVRTVPGGDR